MSRLRGCLFGIDPVNLNQIILAEGTQLEKPNSLNHKHTPSTALVLAEVAVFVALATALSFIIVYTMPQGGAITAGSMVPIIWLALRRGPKVGIAAGIIYGLIQLAVLPYVIDPVQMLLDYPLAFGVLGVAGFFKKYPIAGAAVGITGRFIMHFVAGVFYWAPLEAGGLNPYVYSAIYNGSYLLPELIVSGFIIYLLQKSKVLNIYL